MKFHFVSPYIVKNSSCHKVIFLSHSHQPNSMFQPYYVLIWTNQEYMINKFLCKKEKIV